MAFNPFAESGTEFSMMNGYVKAVSTALNPLQSELTFVLTDFKPNKNAEAVPVSEAENIIRSVVSMPLKANFSQGTINGHDLSLPVGTITHAELKHDPEPHIIAKATFWRSEYKELDAYLRTKLKNGEQVGTSWELFYKESEAEKRDGITWLKNVIIAASTIVRKPAYGDRTPILAIAEESQTDTQNSIVDQLYELECQAHKILDVIYSLYEDAQEADEKRKQDEALSVLDVLPERLKSLIDKIGKYSMTEAELKTALDSALTEVEQLKSTSATLQTELDSFKRSEAESKLLSARAELLNGIVDITDENKEFIMSLSETQFNTYVDQLKLVKSTSEVKEPKIKVPNVIGTPTLSIDAIVAELKNRGK